MARLSPNNKPLLLLILITGVVEAGASTCHHVMRRGAATARDKSFLSLTRAAAVLHVQTCTTPPLTHSTPSRVRFMCVAIYPREVSWNINNKMTPLLPACLFASLLHRLTASPTAPRVARRCVAFLRVTCTRGRGGSGVRGGAGHVTRGGMAGG